MTKDTKDSKDIKESMSDKEIQDILDINYKLTPRPTVKSFEDYFEVITHSFIPFSKLNIDTSKHNMDGFIKKIREESHYTWIGKNKADKSLIIILILGENIIDSSDKFKKFISSYSKYDEILMITDNDIKSHVNKIIKTSYTNIKVYSTDHFGHVLPATPIVPYQCIYNKPLSERDVLSCGTIAIDDPMVIWLQAQPNDIIISLRKNQSTGYVVYFRKVVNKLRYE